MLAGFYASKEYAEHLRRIEMRSGDGPAAEMRAFLCIGNTVIGMEQPHFRDPTI
jgi:hypothetical protein